VVNSLVGGRASPFARGELDMAVAVDRFRVGVGGLVPRCLPGGRSIPRT
jgi:hypothetical protein